MDTKVQVSENGGKDFYIMNESDKHVDNHSLTFKMSDPNYLLIGTDGGVYESFDDTKSWKFVANLPLTQFYKLAVDDAYPFYNIYGGTQDNNTQGGPSRTLKRSGITNSDWFVLLGGDGHQPATEPGNPDIIYASSHQYPFYPGTGNENEIGVGNIFNCPLPSGCDSYLFRELFQKKIIDKINMKFDIIFFSAGFDAHKLDPLASINLENEDFAWVTRAILEKFAKDIPIISLLEGGYDMDGLYNGLDFHLKILDEYSNE